MGDSLVASDSTGSPGVVGPCQGSSVAEVALEDEESHLQTYAMSASASSSDICWCSIKEAHWCIWIQIHSFSPSVFVATRNIKAHRSFQIPFQLRPEAIQALNFELHPVCKQDELHPVCKHCILYALHPVYILYVCNHFCTVIGPVC